MKQNDYQIAKVLLVIMVVSLFGAMYYYFKDNDSQLSWQTYEQSKVNAAKENKLILLVFYNSLNAKTKEFVSIINSDDKIKSKIKNEFILARLKTNDKNDRKIIEKDFKGDNKGDQLLLMNLILDSYSRPVQYLFGGMAAKQIESLMEHVNSLKFILGDNFSKALEKSSQNNKPVFALISDHLNVNIELFEFVKKPENKEFLENNFNITTLLTYTNDDKKTILDLEKKLGTNIIKSDYNKGSFLILDSKKNIIKVIDYTREISKDNNFISEIKKIMQPNDSQPQK